MHSIVDPSEVNSKIVRGYGGLLSCLLYGDWDVDFREFVTEDVNWNSMHEFSGPELLIIVPEEIQPSKKVYLPPEPDNIVKYMTFFEIPKNKTRDAVVVELTDWFNIPFEKLPCLLLFSDIDSKKAYCLSFKNTDFHDTLKEFFSICRKHVRNSQFFNRADSDTKLVIARKEAMDRIIPELKRRKIMKNISQITLSDTLKAASLI